MKVEVLVSTMNKTDLSLIEEMNLKTDAVIINQCDKFEENIVKQFGNLIKIYSYAERGVGKSRNNALMKAEGDICILADDDVIYVNDYEKLILDGFKKYPKADLIVFNVESMNKTRPINKILNEGRVRYFNFMRHGACRIAFKREKILKSNIYFSLMFGGGALYGSGEDTLFIYECLRKGLKIYTYTPKIADVRQDESSWFKGISEKLYHDKGALFAAINVKYARLLSIIFALKWYKQYKDKFSVLQVISYMNNGIKEYKNSNL